MEELTNTQFPHMRRVAMTAQYYPKGQGHSVRKNGSRTPSSLPTPTARPSQPLS